MHPPGTPLHDVTFCAVDFETTGASPRACEIVEMGAVRSRGGQTLGTFQTLVRPDTDVPDDVQRLTGISPWMLDGASPLPVVLPSFLEFSHGAVFVAHNASFDHRFLTEACRCLDYQPPHFEVLDTYRLSRRLLRGEVDDHRLQTLALHLRTDSRPSHRAYPDAVACMEILYALIDRATAYGVRTLQELLDLQCAPSSRHLDKARLARNLPRSPGVYVFADARGETVYVGRATDLRVHVRSYFMTEDHKRVTDLRAETASVEVVECATELEARAIEARLVERRRPRRNRRALPPRRPAYLRVDTCLPNARVRVVHRPAAEGVHIGPFRSSAAAREAAEVLTAALDGRPYEAAREPVVEDLLRVAGIARELTALAAAGRVELEIDGVRATLHHGRLLTTASSAPEATDAPDHGPLAPAVDGYQERVAIAASLAREKSLRLVHAEQPLAYAWPKLRKLSDLDNVLADAHRVRLLRATRSAVASSDPRLLAGGASEDPDPPRARQRGRMTRPKPVPERQA